jgi:hypothetical protein
MALDFDGSTQYVDCGNDSSLNVTTGITQTAWIYPTANIAEGTIATKRLSYYFQRNNDGRLASYQYGTTPEIYHYSSGTVSLNTWSFVAYTYDGSYIRFYINGALSGETAKTGNISTSAYNLRIGNLDYLPSPRYFDGQIFDNRIYNRGLTPNEIAEIYHRRGADRVWQGLVGWWRLDEKTSGTLTEHIDVAPHNMTSNNSPSPYVASASSEYYYRFLHEAYMAFDGTASIWGSNGTSGWLKLDYGSGNAPVLIGYSIRSYGDPAYQNVMPKNWTFKGSNNDTDWTTLDTRTNVTGWTASAWKEFWFSNSTGYRYYMIDITANNGYSLCTYIAEMKHFTSQYNVVDLSGNGNHGTPYNSPTYQASPHRLRRGVLVS